MKPDRREQQRQGVGVTPASPLGIGTLAVSKVFHSEEQCHTPSKSIGNTSHPIDAISNPFWALSQDGDGAAVGEVWQSMREESKKAQILPKRPCILRNLCHFSLSLSLLLHCDGAVSLSSLVRMANEIGLAGLHKAKALRLVSLGESAVAPPSEREG